MPVVRDRMLFPQHGFSKKQSTYKSTKEERGKKTETHLCFLHSAMPTHVIEAKQGHTKYNRQQPGDTTWGFYPTSVGSSPTSQ